ncbi:hypothetical protein BGZ54_007248 [Gamsiella multidivaricata]|nr:hypothetical protein BGZ54_007248 [Gamsiella multidivaricata]
MNLDRSLTEIENEYMRLYAEIPGSDEESMDYDDPYQGTEQCSALPTLPLTVVSSSALSACSSQGSITALCDRARDSTSCLIPGQQIVDADGDDELDDEEDEPQRHPQRYQHISTDTRPQRMVRVWTQEQSENLRNLIEVHFPGAYRINWVWVAAQMGNIFTRKQCKNKWEIIRRRMGTEKEINQLKRGYQEFRPSWQQIQEKYMPEWSRGGISTMWNLLETRGAEQQQQQQSAQKTGQRAVRGLHHGRYHSTSSLKIFQRASTLKESLPALRTMGDQYDVHAQWRKILTSESAAMDLSLLAFPGRSTVKEVQLRPFSFMSRIFSGPSSSSRARKPISSSSAKKSKSPFMSRFRRAPPPSTMDKLQAKLSPSPETTPSSVAASKRKAKKAKAKKEINRKNKSSSLFGRRH